jgi:hypothetical protein
LAAMRREMSGFTVLAEGSRLTVANAESARRAAASRRTCARRVSRLLVMVAALGLAAASCGGSAARPVGSLRVKPCTVQGRAVRCGTLIVPEDRLTGKGARSRCGS